jgi:hypothetical protein
VGEDRGAVIVTAVSGSSISRDFVVLRDCFCVVVKTLAINIVILTSTSILSVTETNHYDSSLYRQLGILSSIQAGLSRVKM